MWSTGPAFAVSTQNPPAFHMVIFYKDGIPLRTNEKIFGEVYGTLSGKTFKLSENDKIEWRDGEFYQVTWHFNLKGNHGTQYEGSFTFNYITGDIWFNRMVCPGSKE
jgi:hypothetical protein